MRLRLAHCNFLILDEPTNHIDIDGKEELEAQLVESGATLLITAHDRRFIDAVCNRFLWIDNGRLRALESPEPFYQALFDAAERVPDAAARAPAAGHPRTSLAVATRATDTNDEDALLEQMLALENKIAADIARKPKHQKPQQRADWLRALQVLKDRLG